MNARKRRAQRGMTLIEIMVVVIIIGLVGTAVAVNVFGNLAEAKVKTAKSDLAKISEAVDTYKVLRGRFPSTEEGLGLLVFIAILTNRLPEHQRQTARRIGLGLAVVYGIVQQHHGTIECDSVPGCTVFKILIPLP